MAKVTLNALTSHLRGKVGDLVFKHYGDKLVVTLAPKPAGRRTVSRAERGRRSRFSAAVRYASTVLADPAQREAYAPLARSRRRTIQSVAISDYLTLPRIETVDTGAYAGRAGDPVEIDTGASPKVTAVQVQLRDRTGQVLEGGPAVKRRGTWRYLARRAHALGGGLVVAVVATDRAGHAVTAEARVGET